jgi:RHS repeat-associated protein
LNALKLEYNFLNLTGVVHTPGGAIQAQYRWLADGSKVGVKDGGGAVGYEYLGSLIYKRTGGTLALESTGFGGGRITATTGGYEVDYQITDHLGSPRVVFTSRSNIVARNDFYAFGKRAVNNLLPAGNDASNRFLYNGKEKLITGNIGFLDYGARPYDYETGRMTTPDPLSEVDRQRSPFAYARNNPVNAIDLEGKLVVFVNGFHPDGPAGRPYWPNQFISAVQTQLNDFSTPMFRDGGTRFDLPRHLSASSRIQDGYESGLADAARIISAISDENGNITETIKIVTHSMGAAFGKGYVKALKYYFKKHGYSDAVISLVADFDPFQASQLEAEDNVFTQQFTHKKKGEGEFSWLANDRQKNLPDSNYYEDPNQGSHNISTFFNDISNLQEGTYKWNGKEWVLQH